ncbi:MAG: ABC transporter ATP-binding protein [Alicyclobacillus sp.]|nr:ABC transporter ATP-binding protein [Alicyclobacillus sp.]
MTLLSVENLSHYYDRTSKIPTLRNIQIDMDTNDIVALVGESGCGKTTLGKIVSGLIKPTQGTVRFEGKNIYQLTRASWNEYRRSVQMVHQDPYASLNPSLTILETLSAGILQHKIVSRRNVHERVREILSRVGLPTEESFLRRYPHQLSGGQRQRVVIARALAVEPKLIVADECVSMLDVSMRVSVLDLLLNLKREDGLSFLFISHDFGVVRYFASGYRIAVLYFGVLVEEGICEDVIANPQHPYTYALLSAVPVPDPKLNRSRETVHLKTVDEGPRRADGCPFYSRCPFSEPRCQRETPPLVDVGSKHRTACFYPERIPGTILKDASPV